MAVAVPRRKARSAPKSSGLRSLPIEQSAKDLLHLDLDNFETVTSEDCPFILTSPRSLEACDRLEIQPAELLHKPLVEFEEELLLAGQPTLHAKKLYDMYEKLRCSKLKKCKKERALIIREQALPEERGRKLHREERNRKQAYEDHNHNIEELSVESIPCPIYDPTMKSSLRSASCGSLSRMSSASWESKKARDKKIVELMELRRLRSSQEEADKVIRRLAWEEERSKEERMKVEQEMERRKRLTERRHEYQQKQDERRKVAQVKQKKAKQEAVDDLQRKELYHNMLAEKQKEIKHKQIDIHQTWERYKKEKQEKNLEALEKRKALFRENVEDHMTLSLLRAEEVRRRNEKMKQLEIHSQNAAEERKLQQMKEVVEKQKREKLEILKTSQVHKEIKSLHILETQEERQRRKIQQARQERDQKQRSASLSRLQKSKEINEWKNQLKRNKQVALERANEHVNKALAAKVERVAEERSEKERAHQELHKRVKQMEAVKKAHTKAKIQQKDMKSKEIFKEKESAIQESRSYALASAQEREEVRQRYSKSFDKIVKDSEIQASFGYGPKTSAKNYSSIHFG